MGTTIFHIADGARWSAAGTGDYAGDTLATEGFIHCSTAEQVPFVAGKFFRGRTGLLLLEIDPARLSPEVRWEESEPGRLFPHVYGPIGRAAIIRVTPFEPPSGPAPSSDFRRFEHQGWERAARAYTSSFTAVTGRVAEPLLDACLGSAPRPGSRLLDVATGPGLVARLALARGVRAFGVDFASEMLALGQAQPSRTGERASFVRGDADALPFLGDSFDAVACNFGLLHFAHPEQATAEMARLVRRGGRVALSVWSPPERNAFFGSIYRALERHASRPSGVPAGPPFFQFAEPARMKALLEGAGLEAHELERVAFEAPVASPRALLELFLEGSVRTAAILRAQDEATRERILETLSSELAPHRGTGPELLVPVEAVVGRGTRRR